MHYTNSTSCKFKNNVPHCFDFFVLLSPHSHDSAGKATLTIIKHKETMICVKLSKLNEKSESKES